MVHNKDNEIFLKVDCIDPVYYDGYSISGNYCLNGIKVWIGNDGHYFKCDQYTICDPKAAVGDGRRQALNLVRKIMEINLVERRKIFGNVSLEEILKDATYEDLEKKLDTWEKEKETIRVRDEVCHQSMQARFVVTKIFVPSGGEDAIVNGIKKDGTTVKGLLLHNVKKTGLHVDDLDTYLEV